MNVSIYYKTPTILLDNIATIIFQQTINLLCQGRGKCLQLPQALSRDVTRARIAARPSGKVIPEINAIEDGNTVLINPSFINRTRNMADFTTDFTRLFVSLNAARADD